MFVTKSLFTGTFDYNSIEWILENSETAKRHKKTTILAWLHTHVSGNQCNFLSSVDVHMHKSMESTFEQILTIVVEITKKGEKKHQAYDLTQMGRTRAGRCRQHGFHNACARKEFYHKVDCQFIFKEPLKVHTLTHKFMDNGELLVATILESNRGSEDSVMDLGSYSADMEMEVDEELLDEPKEQIQETKCRGCPKALSLRHLKHKNNKKCIKHYTTEEMNELRKKSSKARQEAKKKREEQQTDALQEKRKKRIKENPKVYKEGRKKREEQVWLDL